MSEYELIVTSADFAQSSDTYLCELWSCRVSYRNLCWCRCCRREHAVILYKISRAVTHLIIANCYIIKDGNDLILVAGTLKVCFLQNIRYSFFVKQD